MRRNGLARHRWRDSGMVLAAGTVTLGALGASPLLALDPTFGSSTTPGVVRSVRGSAFYRQDDTIVPLADGSLVVATASDITKLTPTGSRDGTFNAANAIGACWASDLAVDASNRILVALSSGCGSGPPNDVVVRLSATGTRDGGFDGQLMGSLHDTRIVSVDGAVVVAGVGVDGACLYRFRQSDGVLDTTFGSSGTPGRYCVALSGGDGRARAVVRPGGGYTFVAADFTEATLTQLSVSGTLEGSTRTIDLGSSFASVSDVVGMPGDGLLIVGKDADATPGPFLQRVDGLGTLVSTFNPNGIEPGRMYLASDDVEWSIAQFAEGRFVLAGSAAGSARAIMIDEHGNTDVALEPAGPVPGAMTVTPAAPATFSRFSDVAVSSGRVVAIGPEGSGDSLQPLAHTTVIARSDLVGAQHIADTALFRPTQPTRILDTRPGDEHVGYTGTKPAAGDTVELQIAGLAGMPNGGIGAVALNLTATEATGPGFVTVWPSGNQRPLVSSLNLERVGQTVPNLVIVPVGSNGRVSIYTMGGTHMIADVLGWFPANGALHTIQPERILDTRPGVGQVGYAGSKPDSQSTVELQVSGRAGLPQTGVAVAVLNVTMTQTDAPGYVAAWPSGSTQPMTSNVNASAAGQTIQNFVMVPVGANGKINLFTLAGTHLIADLVAWLPPNSGFVPTPPTHSPRAVDTRGFAVTMLPPIPGGGFVTASGPGVQLINVIATNTGGPGYLTIYPSGTTRPRASNVNVERAGQTIANAALVRSGPTGYTVYTLSSAHIVIDSFGSFPLPD